MSPCEIVCASGGRSNQFYHYIKKKQGIVPRQDRSYLLRRADPKLQEFFRRFRANCYFGEFRPFADLIDP